MLFLRPDTLHILSPDRVRYKTRRGDNWAVQFLLAENCILNWSIVISCRSGMAGRMAVRSTLVFFEAVRKRRLREIFGYDVLTCYISAS